MNALLAAYSLVSRTVCAWKAARYGKERKTARRAPLPVISVGNLALGGTGKTPVVTELIGHFLRRGARPALVTRGYRGSWEKSGGVLSDGRSVYGGVREAGDEPVLIARRFPQAGVFIGRDRALSCLEARTLGFELCVLDDAFQHLGLARDLNIVLHHPEAHLPLREGEGALARADVLLLPGKTDSRTAADFRARFPRLDVFEYEVRPVEIDFGGTRPPASPDILRGKRILAFAGIARPERFFDQLEAAGAVVLERLAFPDHYPYPPAGLARIAAAAARCKPEMILTTEKDSVKIASGDKAFGKTGLSVLRIGIDLPAAFFERAEAAVAAWKSAHA